MLNLANFLRAVMTRHLECLRRHRLATNTMQECMQASAQETKVSGSAAAALVAQNGAIPFRVRDSV